MDGGGTLGSGRTDERESFTQELSLFAEDLRHLRLDRGNPSLRDIARRAGQLPAARQLPHGTLSDVFNGKRLPRLELLLALVRTLLAFDEDGRPCQPPPSRSPHMDTWRSRWRALEALRIAARPPAGTVPAEPGEDAAPPAQDPPDLLAATRAEADGIREVARAWAERLIAEAQAERDRAAVELAKLNSRAAEILATARQQAQEERDRASADAAAVRAQAQQRAPASGSGPEGDPDTADADSPASDSSRPSYPKPRVRPGQSAVIRLGFGLEEAAFGATRDILVDTAVVCGTCAGRGAAPGTGVEVCGACEGRGRVPQSTGPFLGVTRTLHECPRCSGYGTLVPVRCPECDGDGRVRERRTLTVKIPAGVENGTRIKLAGEGEVGPGGGAPGDLYVEIEEKEHPVFQRYGDELHCTVTIPMTAAALGTKRILETLDGREEIDIRPGTQPGNIIPLHQRGITHLGGGGRGDLVVHVEVVIPGSLDSAQEILLRQLAAARGEDEVPSPLSPDQQGLFSRLKDAFNR